MGNRDAGAGKEGVSLAPPTYGIDFVDRGLAQGARTQTDAAQLSGGESEKAENPLGENALEQHIIEAFGNDSTIEALEDQDDADAIPDFDVALEIMAHRMAYEKDRDLGLTHMKWLMYWGYQHDPADDLKRDEASDFQARLFRPITLLATPTAGAAPRPVLAFRGTNDMLGWFTDLNPKGVGLDQQEANAEAIGELMERAGDDVILTGHSLGGALAQLVAADFRYGQQVAEIVTFQAPGVSMDTVTRFETNQALRALTGKERTATRHHMHLYDLIDKAGEKHLTGEQGQFFTHIPTGDYEDIGTAHGSQLLSSPRFADAHHKLGLDRDEMKEAGIPITKGSTLVIGTDVSAFDGVAREQAEEIRTGFAQYGLLWLLKDVRDWHRVDPDGFDPMGGLYGLLYLIGHLERGMRFDIGDGTSLILEISYADLPMNTEGDFRTAFGVEKSWEKAFLGGRAGYHYDWQDDRHAMFSNIELLLGDLDDPTFELAAEYITDFDAYHEIDTEAFLRAGGISLTTDFGAMLGPDLFGQPELETLDASVRLAAYLEDATFIDLAYHMALDEETLRHWLRVTGVTADGGLSAHLGADVTFTEQREATERGGDGTVGWPTEDNGEDPLAVAVRVFAEIGVISEDVALDLNAGLAVDEAGITGSVEARLILAQIAISMYAHAASDGDAEVAMTLAYQVTSDLSFELRGGWGTTIDTDVPLFDFEDADEGGYGLLLVKVLNW